MTEQLGAFILKTTGNDHCHLVSGATLLAVILQAAEQEELKQRQTSHHINLSD